MEWLPHLQFAIFYVLFTLRKLRNLDMKYFCLKYSDSDIHLLQVPQRIIWLVYNQLS